MHAEAEHAEEPLSWPAPVLRVGLRWDGKRWTTTDVVRVPTMTLPRPDRGDPEKMSGFWVDTLDEQGRPRYRQRMTDPLLGMELFDEKGEVTRLTHAPHAVDIEVLVPDDVPAAALRITSHPAPREGVEPYTVEVRVDRERIRTPDEQPPPHDHHQ